MAIDSFLRRQIVGLSEAALHAADVIGILPTPLDQVARVAGVAEVINIGDLPDELVAARPKGLRRILGAYLYRAETAFVDLSQPLGRQRFIFGHETGHKIIPWHAQAFHLDDENRIFLDANEELEEEANLAASLLMFQGGRFHARALDYKTSLHAPISLAEQYGASLHASIRFYVEHHPEPVASSSPAACPAPTELCRSGSASNQAHSPSGSARSAPTCRSAAFRSARTRRSRSGLWRWPPSAAATWPVRR